ncbi:hypothetical protein N0V82_010392 [Gnomoniopsis sp. IMI 355080]|nr:hypothetical protein N0V82_010392 [Gnomoniopsis sp. IMI 355080]
MRILLSLVVRSLAILLVAAQPQASDTNFGSATIARRDTDAQIVASYARQGLCMFYFGNQKNETQELASCTTYCSTQNSSDATGCSLPNVDTADLDPSIVYKDESGYEYTPGECFCSAGIATALFDIIAKGLSQLDNVICAVMVSAFESVIEIGLDLTPEAWAEKVGKTAAEDAMKAAVKGAKSFKENGGKAEDVFTNWIGDACGIPSFSFSLDDMFTNLLGASSDWGESIGCKKSSC